MSFGSFFSALSGLQANSQRLSVIGNNLANVNTVGFKSSRVTFHDFFDAAGFNGAGNPSQVGRGTTLASIDPLFSQGSLSTTSLMTDLAMQGKGYFVLNDGNGARAFTRAGNFTFNKDGDLVSTSGRFVQGYTARDVEGAIVASGSLSNINIPTGLTAPPEATQMLQANINLNADFDAEFQTTLTVFDSKGSRHDITMTFTPADTTVPADGISDAWTYEVTAAGDEVAGGTPGTPYVIDSDTITFDQDGNLQAPAGNVTLSIPGWTNDTSSQDITWELYDSANKGLLTGFSSASAISSSNTDGFGAGELRTLLIDQNGLISGIFTNGVNLQLARIAVGTFNNEGGLLRDGQNTFVETNTSGNATIGSANSGGRGSTISNSLELSNVDITQEFTDLIVSQRGYQANSRIVTTTDEVIQEALSLKR